MTASAVILVPLTLAVLAFPFFIGGVDISSVGPPPTQ
jgi:succinate dehydrogenase hydrophobic anchor subunit